jgi:flagellar basal-body rod protein FlgB
VGVTPVSVNRTDPAHIAGSDETPSFPGERQQFRVRPAGNAVSLEDEMMKVANNQMDYQAASALYTRSLTLIKVAIGRK